ncbi:MAG: PEGA domain-containing protein [Acidobacteriota bacterium]|nr:MAG: PEGA domain-containing protein [Acidobacteriota bacterium]
MRIFCCILALGVTCTAASAEIPQTGDAARLEGLLARAAEQYEALALEDAAALLGQILDDPWSKAYPEEARPILVRAHELRGACFYNMGQSERAEKDFTALAELAPAHVFDAALPSRAADLFEEIRKNRVARLTVRSDPAGAAVFVDGVHVGAAPLESVPVLSGHRVVRIELEGFKEHEEALELEIGERADLKPVLSPTHRKALFLTAPSDVEILVDGELAGRTEGHAAMKFAEAAEKRGIALEELSAPFITPPLTEGRHAVRFERPCYEPASLDVDISIDPEARLAPAEFDPVVLKRSTAALEISSKPEGLEVAVDGRTLGRTPFRAEDICSGERRVRVRDPEVESAWFETVTFARDSVVTLDVSPRPTLAFLGIFREGTLERQEKKTKTLAKELRALGRYNLLDVPGEFVPWDKENPETFLGRAIGKFSAAELALTALDRGHETRFFIAAAPNAPPDEFHSRRALKDVLKTDVSVFSASLGMSVMDVRFAEGVYVYYVAPKGPAAEAGIAPGGVLLAVDGRSLGSAEDFHAALEALKPGEEVSLSMAGQEEPLPLRPVATPTLTILSETHASLHSFVSHMRFLARTARDPLEREVALLNLGAALCRLDRPDEALEILSEVEIPDAADGTRRAGIGHGTLQYLFGLAYLKRGDTSSAHDALRAAASSASTLESDFDLPVASLAERLLRHLEP